MTSVPTHSLGRFLLFNVTFRGKEKSLFPRKYGVVRNRRMMKILPFDRDDFCSKNFCFRFLIEKRIPRVSIRLSQWPRGLRRRSTAARLLRSWFRIPPESWISVCCECFVLSGRGLCDELTTRPEESYRLWRVVVC
jgi:hypothetical protein